MPRCNASVVKRYYARDHKSCSCFSETSPRSQDIRRKSQVPFMVWDYALGPELLSMASFSNCICKWLTFKSSCTGVAQVGSPTLSSPIGLASVPLSKGQCCWKAACNQNIQGETFSVLVKPEVLVHATTVALRNTTLRRSSVKIIL